MASPKKSLTLFDKIDEKLTPKKVKEAKERLNRRQRRRNKKELEVESVQPFTGSKMKKERLAKNKAEKEEVVDTFDVKKETKVPPITPTDVIVDEANKKTESVAQADLDLKFWQQNAAFSVGDRDGQPWTAERWAVAIEELDARWSDLDSSMAGLITKAAAGNLSWVDNE